MIFGEQMRDDVVLRMLEGQPNLETSKFLDRLMELSTLEEAEHQFLIDPFDRSVALVFQMFQSVGMTLGIMPITGIPLPFVSYGGSSSLTSFVAVGLVLNVHMRRYEVVR